VLQIATTLLYFGDIGMTMEQHASMQFNIANTSVVIDDM
jgi:hypothetical protein